MAIDQYIQDINAAADQYGIPQNIFQSVIQTESSGNAYAVSPAGAKGLGQLMPVIYRANEYGGAIDPFNPKANLDRSAAFLSDMYKKYGNWDDALSHYNAGFNLQAGRGYAQKVLAGAGVDGSQQKTGGITDVLSDAIKRIGDFARNPFKAVPGAGTAAQVTDSDTVWGIIDAIAPDKLQAALRAIPGGLMGLAAWLVVAFLLYLSITKLIEK